MNLLETRLLLNSTISDVQYGARFFTADISNYFLAVPMKRCEYMKVKVKRLPQDIIKLYNLRDLITEDGYVYIRIDKGIYGLKNATILLSSDTRR